VQEDWHASGVAIIRDISRNCREHFGRSPPQPGHWLSLQNDYDVQIDLGKHLDRIEIVNKPKAAWPIAVAPFGVAQTVKQPRDRCRRSA
jgi:hypothetical protein